MHRVSSLLVVIGTLALLAGGGPLPAEVVINEVHYHPADKTSHSEFIELHNPSESPEDISGWFLSEGVFFRFRAGTVIGPEEYLVVTESPVGLRDTFGYASGLGPWEGRLSNDGERIVLRDASGRIVDQVDYQATFPWPIASDGNGSSMELIHPSLDNDLGMSWRASGLVERPARERETLLARGSEWSYRKATSEPSDPVEAWRQPGFVEDATWQRGPAGFGYGDGDDATVLEDMRGSYTGVYLRKTFTVGAASLENLPPFFRISLLVDDGAVIWINGVEALRFSVPDGELAFDGIARAGREARWTDIDIDGPASFLVAGENTIAIHALNRSLTSSDFSIDAEVMLPGSEDLDPDALAPPTPGARNTVFSEVAPPHIRQVVHSPRQPAHDRPVVVTARVTDPDGVASVALRVQVVEPGRFVPAFLPLASSVLLSRPTTPLAPNPAFEDPASWSEIPMRDDGESPDAVAGDGVWSASVDPRPHRTLVRYRIVAQDSGGASITAPLPDDPSLNFAWFVYDGVPDYATTRASVHPEGAGHVWPAELMRSLPVYHVITRAQDMTQCVGYSSSDHIPKSNEAGRDKFNWECAFVYEGFAYDHVRYRLRQANDRYGGSGKRSFRYRFPRGNWLRARDDYGRRYPARWRTLNVGKQFDNKRVGNFGLTESLNSILWNLVGVPAPYIHAFSLRVIDAPEEAPQDSLGQYHGDFWGMFSAFEDYDPRFLDVHGLEDGNLYKLKDGIFNGLLFRRNQGRDAVTTDADFQNIRRNLRPTQSLDWLLAHVSYERWYPYHTVVEAIRHYDFKPADSHSKNRAWYFEPIYDQTPLGRLWTLPHDSDASWGPNWNQGIDYSMNAIYASGGQPTLRQEYRNFIREFRDLIWTEEVIDQMIDDLAARVIEFSRADRDRWRGAPADAGRQDFGAIETKILDMKRFAFVGWSGSTGPTVPAGGRARHLENLAGAEGDRTSIPETPVVVSTSPAGFPADALTFTVSPFADPQGDSTFSGLAWRAGEVDDPAAPGYDPSAPRVYEWPAVWKSGVIGEFHAEIQVPPEAVRVGHRYRVRARARDDTNRWSHWSDPVELVVSEPEAPFPIVEGLRVTEVMYSPRGDSGFEFVELTNVGPGALDLSSVSLRGGVRFAFPSAGGPRLGAGERMVIARDRVVFATRYGTGALMVAGDYEGRLDGRGERITLVWGAGHVIQDFEYDPAWYPEASGGGHSIVASDPARPGRDVAWSLPEGWGPSAEVDGSPGAEDVPLPEGLVRPGDATGDGRLDISDAVSILRHLFLGDLRPLPCADGTLRARGNREVLDSNGDGSVDLSDGVHVLLYLFAGGAPHSLGADCAPVAGCPDLCAP